ncbi:MAG: hypothetical protein KDA37_09965 [Planctomycetales bacterium]|nr:hypothetical protein [Planctomycetales bacterium]
MDRYRLGLSWLVLAAGLIALSAPRVEAGVLFQDTFNRDDSRNIDASLAGITDNTGSSLVADGVYTLPHLDPANDPGPQDSDAANGGGAQVLSQELRLAVGAGTSNAYINHNFINNEILAAGGFNVSVDIPGYGGSARQNGGGFAIGMSQTEADSAGDAFNTANPNMTGAYNPDPFGVTGQPVGPSIVSDFWIGIRGNNSLAWGSSSGNVLGVPANGLPAKTGSLSVDFALSDFNAGSPVSYRVFYNGVFQGAGSFTWSGTNENYIGLDGRSGEAVIFDNLTITTLPEPASMALALLGGVVCLVRRRVAG